LPEGVRPIFQVREDDSLRRIELQRIEIENKRMRMRALELGVRLPEPLQMRAKIEPAAARPQTRQSGSVSIAVAREHLRSIRSLADSVRETMLGPVSEDPEDHETFEGDEEPAQGLFARFPMLGSKDSVAYRAEAIRAFLEKEIGLEKLAALQRDLVTDDANPFTLWSRAIDPRLLILAQQLLLLDERLSQA
jgi:hypothetical protein